MTAPHWLHRHCLQQDPPHHRAPVPAWQAGRHGSQKGEDPVLLRFFGQRSAAETFGTYRTLTG